MTADAENISSKGFFHYPVNDPPYYIWNTGEPIPMWNMNWYLCSWCMFPSSGNKEGGKRVHWEKQKKRNENGKPNFRAYFRLQGYAHVIRLVPVHVLKIYIQRDQTWDFFLFDTQKTSEGRKTTVENWMILISLLSFASFPAHTGCFLTQAASSLGLSSHSKEKKTTAIVHQTSRRGHTSLFIINPHFSTFLLTCVAGKYSTPHRE